MNGIETLNVRNFPNLYYSAVQRKMDPGAASTMSRYKYTQVETSEPKSTLEKLCKIPFNCDSTITADIQLRLASIGIDIPSRMIGEKMENV